MVVNRADNNINNSTEFSFNLGNQPENTLRGRGRLANVLFKYFIRNGVQIRNEKAIRLNIKDTQLNRRCKSHSYGKYEKEYRGEGRVPKIMNCFNCENRLRIDFPVISKIDTLLSKRPIPFIRFAFHCYFVRSLMQFSAWLALFASAKGPEN